MRLYFRSVNLYKSAVFFFIYKIYQLSFLYRNHQQGKGRICFPAPLLVLSGIALNMTLPESLGTLGLFL